MKNILSLFLFVNILFQIGFGQNDTVVYYMANNKPANESNATKYIEIKNIKKNRFSINTFNKNKDDWMLSPLKKVAYIESDSTIRIITEFKKKKYNKETLRKFLKKGSLYHFKDFNKDGQLIMEGLSKTILPLHLEGEIVCYYESGNILSVSQYENNQLKSNKNWLENGEEYYDNIFESVDKLPEYPGGDVALRKHIAHYLNYPNIAKENGIQGRVFVKFIIDEEGFMKGVHIVRGVDPVLDAEAKRVIETLPEEWSVGILDGEKVRVAFTIPLNFQLN